MKPPMIEELEIQLMAANLRLAELNARQAAMRREFLVDRITVPADERAVLADAVAHANRDKCRLELQLKQAKVLWRAGRRDTMYHALVKVVQDHGCAHFLDLASQAVQTNEAGA